MLIAMEGVCVLCDWGRPSLHDDPFVGFESVRPLFVLNEAEDRWEIPRSRQTYFRPESFAAKKGPDEFRIFCIGGSTVQGRPFAVETAFSTWLEMNLDVAEPSREWETVNCGGVSYASYRLTPILEETLRHEPDLIILYTGHNEFLEERAFEHVKGRGTMINGSLHVASRLRTFTLMREGYLRLRGESSDAPPPGRAILPEEVDALLDYRGGLEAYHRDDAHRQGVVDQFQFNLRRMVELAKEASVPLILVNPVSNLRDAPPFKSEHRDGLTSEEKQAWESAFEEARRCYGAENRDLLKAIRLLEEARRIDPLHAGGVYQLAHCYDATGQTEEAREAYREARELDACPLRILQVMNDAVLEIAEETETPILDAQLLFEQRSEEGLVGGEWLLDHVHPGMNGHFVLAAEMTDLLIELELVEPVADHSDGAQQRFQEHLDSLDDPYFQHGMDRLQSLRNWSQGRGDRVRGEVN